jgi:hypothetical protein
MKKNKFLLSNRAIIFLVTASFLFSFDTIAQGSLTGCPKIIFHSSQLFDKGCDTSIKRLYYAILSEDIYIKYKNNSKTVISPDSVWGVRMKNDFPYRFYKGNHYLLYDVNGISWYSRKTGKYTDYYFSAALDSPIYPFNQKQLKLHTDAVTYAAFAERSNKSRHEMSVAIYLNNTNLADHRLWGLGLDLVYFLSPKFATGIYLNGAGGNMTDSFSFSVIKPYVTGFDIGWLNRYMVVKTGGVRTGIGLLTGLAVSTLSDKGIIEKVKTRFGYKNRAKKISENYHFLLEPTLDLSVKLFSDSRQDLGVYLTAKTGYRLAVGAPQFGSNGMFSGYFFTAGVTIGGFNREKL